MRPHRAWAILLVGCAVASGCFRKAPPPLPPPAASAAAAPIIVPMPAKPPAPTVLQATFAAGPALNADRNGRASPVVVKVYELKSLAVFQSADFFSLLDKDKETLGADLVRKDEFPILPGTTTSFEREVQADTHHVGVVAAFRDLGRAAWRASTSVAPNKTTKLSVHIDGSSIKLATQ